MISRLPSKQNLNQNAGAVAEGSDSILADVLEPSNRHLRPMAGSTAQHPLGTIAAKDPLSELTVPRNSRRIGFNEFLD